MVDKKASDMHLKDGRPPLLRVSGKLMPLDMEILAEKDLKEMIYAITDEMQRKQFEQSNEMDLAYNLEGVARFRANVFKQMGKLEVVLRAIPIKIPTLEELNLPSVLNEISLYPRGMVLVTGSTGTGKSTTLAAMINKINENYNRHIVTIEDPIEFVHSDKKSSVSQREVGLDTESFSSALKYVLRQDPDVILIGEMRDPVTVETALSAAETGHMVFSTLHTIDTIQTINRILDFFEKEEQGQVRMQLAGALRAVISLRLVRRSDGGGMAPAVEVMVVTPTVRGYIEDGKIGHIKDLIKDGAQNGMQTFDQSLISLYKQGLITIEEAKRNATSQQEIDLAMKGITSSRSSAQSILDNMMKEQGKKDLDGELRKARQLMDQQRFTDAYSVLEKLSAKYPGSPEIGDMLQKVKSSLNTEQHTQTIKAMIVEGLNIYKKGNIEGAILKWKEGLRMDPENPQLKSYVKSAEEKLEAASAIPQMLAEGVNIYKKGDFSGAIAKWDEVLRVDPSNKQARTYIDGAEHKRKEQEEKKEIEDLFNKGKQESENGNDLEALILFKRALSKKSDSKEIKEKYDEVYKRLINEDFGGSDVESALMSEAFKKGIDKLLQEDYINTVKEWKKAIEKRPLEKKLKNYVENVKTMLKARLEALMTEVDELYRDKRNAEALHRVNIILGIDPANEFALKYMRDLKPLVEEEAQKMYKEAIDMFNAGRLKEAKDKINVLLTIDPSHITAKKRLQEIESRLESQKDVG